MEKKVNYFGIFYISEKKLISAAQNSGQRSEEREEKIQNVILLTPFCEVLSTFLSFLTFHASDPYLDFLIKFICK